MCCPLRVGVGTGGNGDVCAARCQDQFLAQAARVFDEVGSAALSHGYTEDLNPEAFRIEYESERQCPIGLSTKKVRTSADMRIIQWPGIPGARKHSGGQKS